MQSCCFFHSIHVSSCIRLVTQLSCICRTTIWPLAKDSLEGRDESHPITTPAADPPEGSIHRSRGRSSSSDCRVVAKSSLSTLRTANIQTLTRVKPCSVIAVLSAQNLYTGARLNISAIGRPYREQARTAARPEACSQWAGAPPRSDCCLALPGDYTHDLCRPPTTHTRLFCFPIFPPQSESVLRTIALHSELLETFPKASLLPQGFRLDCRWPDHHIHHIAADFDHSSGYLSSIPHPLALSSR